MDGVVVFVGCCLVYVYLCLVVDWGEFLGCGCGGCEWWFGWDFGCGLFVLVGWVGCVVVCLYVDLVV